MKKISTFLLVILLAQNISFAGSFGTYKPEYEYGLFDGIKFNFFGREKNEKIIEVREDSDKKIEDTAKTKKDQDKKDDEEYQMYKFMLDNTVVF